MLNEPCWVTPQGVIRINQRAVADSGEPHVLVHPGLLESACDRPRTHWQYDGENDVVVLGATLLFGIARNHPFLQGNKRTAYAAMIGFLGANGYRLDLADHIPNADYIVAAIAGQMTDAEFIQAIRPGCHRAED